MRVFNAVNIEHTLAKFFGDDRGMRGEFYDADVFRGGQLPELAEVIERTATRIQERAHSLTLTEGTFDVERCVAELREMAEIMKKRSGSEREDYHWEIFCALIKGIDGLLAELESREPTQ
jgi:hypothetical protein